MESLLLLLFNFAFCVLWTTCFARVIVEHALKDEKNCCKLIYFYKSAGFASLVIPESKPTVRINYNIIRTIIHTRPFSFTLFYFALSEYGHGIEIYIAVNADFQSLAGVCNHLEFRP